MLCLFFSLLNNFSVIPVVREKIEVEPALAILIGATTILVNKQIDTPPLNAIKTIIILSM